ncbi:glycosyltransferase family 1 protein [Campylobacter sp. MIT 99-7217]|uniref:glycosyltransferase family 4 protein n=1 Tax=Campylobacter sp. MIT 99-7217 TaxID=535091 RepID=UPI00115B4C77|nr:glycosyltransferase family 4 protein [Campylobacter sp. MIT 99-7217]TQR33762.1 glycosyltransferase family 1 protein [Campylobacter sp. MIT 99-7217]
MKIAFLSHSAMSVYHFRMPIIKALKARGDEVLIIVPDDEYSLKLKNLGFEVINYELKRSSTNPFIVFSNFLSLLRLLKALKIDLIQSSAHKSNTLGIIASKFAKIPHRFALVEGLGSFYIDEDFKSLLIRSCINFLYKITFIYAQKIIFVSKSDELFMQNLGLKKEKSVLISSVGVNLRQFFPMQIPSKEDFLKKYDLPDKPIVLMIARTLWHKGIKEFYEAASLLRQRANFILVGGSDDNKSCANKEFLNSGCVKYLGEQENINFFLNLCDIFVLPSYKEGFPRTVLEAKACAKACVVSDCDGCVEAVKNGFDGLWARTRDSKDLAEKIELLLVDERLRVNLAQNAFKDALNYDENIIASKYLKLYDEALKQGK